MEHADPASRLEAILVAENEALARHDAAAATALLDEKLKAAQELSAAGLSLEACARLRALAAENRRLLERAIEVQTQIIALVARAARGAPPVARYGAKGRAVGQDGALALARQA